MILDCCDECGKPLEYCACPRCRDCGGLPNECDCGEPIEEAIAMVCDADRRKYSDAAEMLSAVMTILDAMEDYAEKAAYAGER